MNDRIRKIAIEADAWCDKYYFGDKFYDIEWETKFAELIVRECLGIVNRHEYSYHEADPLWETAQLIKEHFGVTE
jgi:hypothetical protein